MKHGSGKTSLATFAGGCFWCMVKPFDELPGILSLVSGYTGGHTENPTYEEVGTETTGHYEAVQIRFNPDVFPYSRLLDIYWRLIDPTDAEGQFMDRGASYRSAIFVHDEAQREQAEASKRRLQLSGRFKGKIVTPILPRVPFILRRMSIRTTIIPTGMTITGIMRVPAGILLRSGIGGAKRIRMSCAGVLPLSNTR